ncbi:MAG: outer membrane protein assembly factor [Bacteroidales bacterium]|nr:outer membrane protein assembly factor [Bacteroidales bacterium]
MKRFIFISLSILLSSLAFTAYSQEDSLATKNNKEEKIKDGWTFGAVPVIAYDSDLGFKYGGLVNFYNYGKPTSYPEYLQSIYLEISRTTKGSGINQISFDSEHMFPNKPIRITGDFSYLTDQALDFYGFNGYQSAYISEFEDDNLDNSLYKSRMYYRMERKMIRFTADFSGNLFGENIKWVAGFAHVNHKMGSVDVNALNEGLDQDDLLPSIDSIPGLYDEYVNWGIISQKEADGGKINCIKLGTVYDTRDNEANPMSGIWSEIIIVTAPKFLDNYENDYTQLSLTHRQYFTLIKSKLSLAYRLGYQGTIAGETPFYMLPYLNFSYNPSIVIEGLGGSKSIRGVLRDRVIGDGIVFGNIEFRWKFIKTVIKNQNLYIALSTFTDFGKVVQETKIDKSNIPDDGSVDLDNYFDSNSDKLHLGYGLGLHFALNENFIVAFDYGLANDIRDGSSGLYIGMNFLF